MKQSRYRKQIIFAGVIDASALESNAVEKLSEPGTEQILLVDDDESIVNVEKQEHYSDFFI